MFQKHLLKQKTWAIVVPRGICVILQELLEIRRHRLAILVLCDDTPTSALQSLALLSALCTWLKMFAMEKLF